MLDIFALEDLQDISFDFPVGLRMRYALVAWFSETQESVLHKTRRASTTGRFHPTATVARFFVELWRSGLLHHWVQQNHDGLPQKVGHGSLACCPDKF